MLGALKKLWEENAPVRAVVGYLPKVSVPLTGALVVLTLVSAVAPVAFTVATGVLVGHTASVIAGGGATSADLSRGVLLAIIAGALFAAPQLLNLARMEVMRVLGGLFEISLRQRVMRATTGPVGIAHLEEPKTLDQIAIGRGLDGSTNPRNALPCIAELGDRYIGAAASAVIIGAWKWWLAPVLVAAFMLSGTRVMRGLRAIVDVYVDEASEMRRSEYLRGLALAPISAKEMRVFGLGPWTLERYRTNLLRIFEQVWEKRRRAALAGLLPGLVATGVASLALAMAAFEAMNAEISIASAVILLRSVLALTILSARGNTEIVLKMSAAAMPAILDLDNRAAADRAIESNGRLSATGLPKRMIRFEDVSFAYPGREPIFADLNLEVPAGQSLAIVGANGAGKTTLVKLLARLYDPDSGRLTVDGVDLRDLDARAWQRQVAAIFQDFVQYRLPARDNVALRDPRDPPSLADLERAASMAGALDVIEGLPSGWDTPLARDLTGGAEVSGGEWQRIALARALMAVQDGARVLVLDEPTASLDVRSEAAFYDRFLDLTTGITSVVISHRFSTVRRADRIVVLEGGSVVEDGTHTELIALDGRYAHSYNLQAGRFVESEQVFG